MPSHSYPCLGMMHTRSHGKYALPRQAATPLSLQSGPRSPSFLPSPKFDCFLRQMHLIKDVARMIVLVTESCHRTRLLSQRLISYPTYTRTGLLVPIGLLLQVLGVPRRLRPHNGVRLIWQISVTSSTFTSLVSLSSLPTDRDGPRRGFFAQKVLYFLPGPVFPAGRVQSVVQSVQGRYEGKELYDLDGGESGDRVQGETR